MTLRQRAMKRKKKPKTVSGTDINSGLSDDLLLKILFYLPTQVAISTCVLSKRWQFLWLWLPKLKYGTEFDSESECKRLRSFIDRTLTFRAPVIESFHLSLPSKCFEPEDIRDWVAFAISRHLRKLKITTSIYFNKPKILPSSFYNCKSLVSLEVHGHIRLDVPRMDCLPSLTTLNLTIGKHIDGESLQRLLSICPVLENLYVDCDNCDSSNKRHMGLFTINVPSLLILHFSVPRCRNHLLDGLVIDSPSLEILDIEYYVRKGHSCLFKSNVSNLQQAYLDFRCHDDISSLIQFVTSVKHLSICLRDIVYGGGFVFSQLEHLKLCVCSDKSSSNLFMQLLEASPNLRVLDIIEMDNHNKRGAPTSIGEHILSSLQAYDSSRYLKRRPKDKYLKVYILGKHWWPKDRCMLD